MGKQEKERVIEQRLQQIPTRIINHFTIAAILEELGYKKINDKIAWLIKNKVLIPLKKGVYVYVPLYSENLLTLELIANMLLSPSYVSLDYALYYYNIIPERICEITSMTINRAKKFQTPYGIFSYQKMDNQLFSVGLRMQRTKNISFIIATKEKALCDKVFFTKRLDFLRGQNEMIEFLEDDLRVDLDEFKNADLNIFDEYFKITRSKKIGILTNVMKRIANEHH